MIDIANKLQTLSPQQTVIYHLLLTGESDKAIAHRVGLEPATVKMHAVAVRRKMGVRTRQELMANVILAQRLEIERLQAYELMHDELVRYPSGHNNPDFVEF